MFYFAPMKVLEFSKDIQANQMVKHTNQHYKQRHATDPFYACLCQNVCSLKVMELEMVLDPVAMEVRETMAPLSIHSVCCC